MLVKPNHFFNHTRIQLAYVYRTSQIIKKHNTKNGDTFFLNENRSSKPIIESKKIKSLPATKSHKDSSRNRFTHLYTCMFLLGYILYICATNLKTCRIKSVFLFINCNLFILLLLLFFFCCCK